MIKIVLISHGPFCQGLLESLEMITGPQEGIQALSLVPGMSPDSYRDDLDTVLSKLEGPVMVFCDLKGGTPYNTAGSLKQKYDFKLITGMNLPMLITVVTQRTPEATVEELTAAALEKDNIGVELIDFNQRKGEKHAKLSLNKNR